MSTNLTFFAGRTALGSATVDSQWEPNLAFFCPVCGEVWGRIVSDSAPGEWWSVTRNCSSHVQPALLSFMVPGSLWYALRHRWRDMPDGVVLREAELMLDQTCTDNNSLSEHKT